MKPAVAEYLHQKETVRGSLQDIDARIILAIDELQRAAGVSGDLLEIGVSYGQRAILLGYCVQASERLVVCDTFEDTKGIGCENRADHAHASRSPDRAGGARDGRRGREIWA